MIIEPDLPTCRHLRRPAKADKLSFMITSISDSLQRKHELVNRADLRGHPQHTPPLILQKQGAWLCVGTAAPLFFLESILWTPPIENSWICCCLTWYLSYQGFWIYLYFRIRHSFAHVWTILNKMASFGVNIYQPSASEHGQNITNITMI